MNAMKKAKKAVSLKNVANLARMILIIAYVMFIGNQLFMIPKLNEDVTILSIAVVILLMELLPGGRMYSLDDSDQQANLEQAFITIFYLNQRVLPSLYFVIFFLVMILQEKQIVAYLVVLFIHIYINVTNMNLVQKYFRQRLRCRWRVLKKFF